VSNAPSTCLTPSRRFISEHAATLVLNGHTGSDGRWQLSWFLPLPRPGDGLGGADDLLREFRGGLIPRHGSDKVSGPLPIEDVSRGGGEEVVDQGEVGGGSPQEVGELPISGDGAGMGQGNPFDFEVRH